VTPSRESISVVAVHARLASQRVDGHVPFLFGAEASLVHGAMPHRIIEFSAGRSAARRAMQALGVHPSEVLQGEGGEPIWPAGLSGSISHSNLLAVSLVAPSTAFESVGVDVDDGRPLGDAAAQTVASRRELRLLLSVGLARSDEEAQNFAFSIKEAVFKCQYVLTGNRALRFHQARLVEAPLAGGGCIAVAGWRTSAAVDLVLRRIVLVACQAGGHAVFCALVPARPQRV
jgi:4'-phosphopantetheinyl transferase EntD